MPRIRTISQTQNIFASVGLGAATGYMFASGSSRVGQKGTNVTGLIQELFRVQDYSHSFNLDPQPVSQFGDLAPLDYVALNPPNASLSFSYLLSNMNNEKVLGFTLCSGALVGCLSGILTQNTDEKNYFIPTAAEGVDLHGATSASNPLYTVAIGNGFITNYQLQAAVGQYPTVSVDIQGSNYEIDSSYSGNNPAISTAGTTVANNYYEIPTGSFSQTNISGLITNNSLLSVSALRSSDCVFTLDYNGMGPSTTDWKVQSVNLSIPFNREDVGAIGNRFAIARSITPPITSTLSITALVGDKISGSLNDIFASCSQLGWNASLVFRGPCTQGNLCAYIFKGMTMVSQESSSSVGSAEQVTLNFIVPIGGASSTGVNVFMSGHSA